MGAYNERKDFKNLNKPVNITIVNVEEFLFGGGGGGAPYINYGTSSKKEPL